MRDLLKVAPLPERAHETFTKLMREHAAEPWINTIIDSSARTLPDGSPLLVVKSKQRMHSENEAHTVARFAKALAPRLDRFAFSSDVKVAGVVIKPPRTTTRPPHLFEGTRMDALRDVLRDGFSMLKVEPDDVTLYQVRLGRASWGVVSIYHPWVPQSWEAFESLKEHIEKRFRLQLRWVRTSPYSRGYAPYGEIASLSHPPAVPKVFLPSTASHLGPARSLFRHLPPCVENWEGHFFTSSDNTATTKREDASSCRLLEPEKGLTNSPIQWREMIPLAAGPGRRFDSNRPVLAIGTSAHIQPDGRATNPEVRLVFGATRAHIDTAIFNDYIESRGDPRASKYGSSRWGELLTNNDLRHQIDLTLELGRRRMLHNHESCRMRFHKIAHRDGPHQDLRFIQAEMLVGLCIDLTEQNILEWWRSANAPAFPLVTLRPHLEHSPILARIRALGIPAHHHQICNPGERNRIADALTELGRGDLLKQFVVELKRALSNRQETLIEAKNADTFEDLLRIKANNALGEINNLNIAMALLGLRGIEPTKLRSAVPHIRGSSLLGKASILHGEVARCRRRLEDLLFYGTTPYSHQP